MRRAISFARTLAACPLLAVSVTLAVAQMAASRAAEAVAGVRTPS